VTGVQTCALPIYADVVILIGEIDPSPRFAREAHVVQIGSNAGACHLRLGGLPLRPTPPARPDWIARCRHWKQRWLAELPPSVSDSDLHPYLFYSFFYQTFTDPKMIVATVDDKWFFPAYQQLQNNPGDRFVPCPFPEDLIAFVSSLETTLPIFLFLGGRRFLSITEFQELVHLNIFIVCLNDVSRTLTSEEYDERIESDTLWYPEEVAEATGVPFLSLDTDTFTDITALVGVDGPYFIEVQCTEDFTPHPRGRKDLPLELMEPFLHWTDIQGEMLIEPIYPK